MSAYTPGWTRDASAFMERRTARSHGWAILGRLAPGMRLLDVGCGPGSITVGLAEAVAPGEAVGVDREPSQLGLARARAEAHGLVNLSFERADAAGALPFPDGRFDAAFAHALLEHLPDPARALAEMARVVRPGGIVVAVSPDWGGFLTAPADPAAAAALAFYERLQIAHGGDVRAGHRLGEHMSGAGLAEVEMEARYETYADRTEIAEYLAARIERSPSLDDIVARGGAGRDECAAHAAALRHWARLPGGLFAQAWVAAAGRVASP